MNAPVITFESQQQAEEYLAEWQGNQSKRKKVQEMKFKVGDKIRITNDYCDARKGFAGTVRGYDNDSDEYAVFFSELEKEDKGHNCNGRVPEGGGQYVHEDYMELLDTPTPVPTYPPVSTVSPIMRFESQQQLEESLTEWQGRLLLSDWIIMAKLVKPEELEKDGRQLGGFNSHVDTLMSSEISIADGDFPDSVTKVCAEESLVHELLHLKLPMFIVDGSIESCLYNDGVHATIEQLAKSLLMAKYNLSLSWFKNF